MPVLNPKSNPYKAMLKKFDEDFQLDELFYWPVRMNVASLDETTMMTGRQLQYANYIADKLWMKEHPQPAVQDDEY